MRTAVWALKEMRQNEPAPTAGAYALLLCLLVLAGSAIFSDFSRKSQQTVTRRNWTFRRTSHVIPDHP